MTTTKQITFCAALREKYRPEALDDEFENIVIAPRRRALNLRQQDHKYRVVLALDGSGINHAGSDGEIEETCPLIEELDLSDNCFCQFDQVIRITNQLKNLSFLNLSHNLFSNVDTSFIKKCTGSSCSILKTLILNNTKIKFSVVFQLLELFSRNSGKLPAPISNSYLKICVTELHLSLNGLSHVPERDDPFGNVESLHYSNNGLKEWDDVMSLGKMFPNLQTLIICENSISKINCEVSDILVYFSKLKKLSLSDNLIDNWQCLETLNSFPLLSNVRLRNLPLLEQYIDEKKRRWFLMVRLPKVRSINGSLTDEAEREDAERMVLRYFKYKENKPTIYQELYKKHGELDDLVDVNLDKGSHALVTIKGDIEKPVAIKLEFEKTCKELRKEISQKHKIPLAKLRLFHFDIGSPNPGTLMNHLQKTMKLYHIKDGDEIEVQRLDIFESRQ